MPKNHTLLKSAQGHTEKAQRAQILAERQNDAHQNAQQEIIFAVRELSNAVADLIEHIKNQPQ